MSTKQGYVSVYSLPKVIVLAPCTNFMLDPDENGLFKPNGNVQLECGVEVVRGGKADELGQALRRALDATIFETPRYPDEELDARFPADLARLFGLRTDRSPYAGMKSCEVERRLDAVTMSPMRKLHGGTFEGFTGVWVKGHEDVRVRWSDTDEALGLALQECIARCL